MSGVLGVWVRRVHMREAFGVWVHRVHIYMREAFGVWVRRVHMREVCGVQSKVPGFLEPRMGYVRRESRLWYTGNVAFWSLIF